VRSYLLIESRSDQESAEVATLRRRAAQLCRAGHRVTLFLVQNAVLTGDVTPTLAELLDAGVEIWADDFSLANRGLAGVPRPAGLRTGGMPELVRMLMAPDVVPVWH
jgi:hypothetical protein